MLLAEHGIILRWRGTLLGKQIHDLSDLLTQLSKSLHNILFVCKLVQNLLDHVSQLVHDAVLQVQ